MTRTLPGIAALLPLVLGPIQAPVADQGGITASLCGGGSIVIPFKEGTPVAPPAPCDAKGCHATCKRKRF